MDLLMNYILEKRPIKHARIKVSSDQSVRVVVPAGFSKSEIETLIKQKQGWIEKHLKHFKAKPEKIGLHKNQILLLGNRYTYFYSPDLHYNVIINHEHKTIQAKKDLIDEEVQLKWYRQEARRVICNRVEELAKKHRFSFNKVFIRGQRTKWGNCSKEKNLSFNWRLIKTPQLVIDYIIIHELLHTETMNHSRNFWLKLKMLYPEYKQAIEWLERYGGGL